MQFQTNLLVTRGNKEPFQRRGYGEIDPLEYLLQWLIERNSTFDSSSAVDIGCDKFVQSNLVLKSSTNSIRSHVCDFITSPYDAFFFTGLKKITIGSEGSVRHSYVVTGHIRGATFVDNVQDTCTRLFGSRDRSTGVRANSNDSNVRTR